MDTLNIGGNEKDRFYRYKMPKLISKIEGKGNGIKTVVPNMSDIARSLGRPPTYPTKFFGCELGAQVKCDEKTDRYIVNGSHDAEKLQELLDSFIKKFVLCAGCNNPETELIIGKAQKIIRDCKACGQRTDVDMRHKLVTFILKNPPNSKGSSKKDKKAASKKNGSGGAPDSTTAPPDKADGSEEGSEDELTRQIKSAAAELPTADERRDEDEDWVVDTSPEAVNDLGEGVKKLLVGSDEDDEDDEEDVHEHLSEWLEENQDLNNKEIYKKLKELEIQKEDDKILQILVLGLFDETFKDPSKVHKRAKLLQKYISGFGDQLELLGATEKLVGVKHKELLESKTICNIFMEYYQSELIEEDAFLAWLKGRESATYKKLFGEKASINYVDPEVNKDIRNKAKPFAKWLEEADEDEDEDED